MDERAPTVRRCGPSSLGTARLSSQVPMSRATVLGLLVGIGLFVASVLLATDNISIFFSLPSLLLVVGGTLANATISYQWPTVQTALGDIGRMFQEATRDRELLQSDVARLVEWSRVVRVEGILALEERLDKGEARDHLLRQGLQLVVDGWKPPEVRQLLGNHVESEYFRSTEQVPILRNMAATAPAFGMVGTLVGLIIMLDSLSGDPAILGTGLALALLTTLYGVLLARLLFQPAADKTLQRERFRRFRSYLLIEGFVLMAEGEMPRAVELKLNSYLDPDQVLARPTPTQVTEIPRGLPLS